MAVRTSEAQWEGDLRGGRGTMVVGKGAWEGQYSFASRFEDGQGTNPEELLAAAHAGCFSMALAGNLAQAGYPPRRVRTIARATVLRTGDGFGITKIELETEAQVPGISEQAFQEQAALAKAGCPVSKALAAVPEITLQARLV